MSEERWELPPDWEWRKAGEIAKIVGGGTPPAGDESNFDNNNGIPWITPADLTGYEDTYITRGRRCLSQKGLASCGAQVMPAGTVLYSSRAPIGYCAIASNPVTTNRGFKSLVLHDGYAPEFIRYYLLSAKEYAESLASGTTFKELSAARLAELLIPITSFERQRRVVRTIDGLFARSKTTRKELERIPHLVERYKQVVLNAAFRGDLTAEWRNKNSGAGIDFLKRDDILPLKGTGLPSLPRGWQWVAAGALTSIKSGITLGKKRPVGTPLIERPYLRVANVQRGWLDLREVKIVAVTEKEAESLYLQPGDVLMNEGGDRDKLGRGWIWNGEIANCIHQNHVFRLRPKSKDIPSKYISYYANEFGQTYFFREGKQTTNLASISMTKLSGLPIPIAPSDEMALIVSLIEAAFMKIDRITAETARAERLLDRLKEVTLDKAFRGELVAGVADESDMVMPR